MIRIEIAYGGQAYSVAVDDPAAFHDHVLQLVSGGGHHWLEVDRGEGALEPTSLLLGPGASIALTVVAPAEGAGIEHAAG